MSREDARRNRARLIEVAAEVFAEVGADAASMNDIARRAGVGPGTLWRHFPNKDALIAEVVGTSLDALAALATDLRDHPDFLREWLTALVTHITQHRGLAARLTHAPTDGPLSTRCHPVEQATADLVARARTQGMVRPDLTPAELIHLATAIAWITETTPATPPRLTTLLFDGLTP
ncbi:TetR/AcrR family transcriptional regulator [Actinokineospora globicatena]|uniref:TetR family transcriptional regulator n=1 Tax=Actinokineospora globicatena TaxID=103729 RepID=A0A9W6QK43_9PSEU|nr:TetR/AcrR family transcriptional regulator [Actinokineospora globicatena]GLW91140.1 TetR family transcriptional regulator [Actinokineospora globicatena]